MSTGAVFGSFTPVHTYPFLFENGIFYLCTRIGPELFYHSLSVSLISMFGRQSCLPSTFTYWSNSEPRVLVSGTLLGRLTLRYSSPTSLNILRKRTTVVALDDTSRKKGEVAEKHSSFIFPLRYRKVAFHNVSLWKAFSKSFQ